MKEPGVLRDLSGEEVEEFFNPDGGEEVVMRMDKVIEKVSGWLIGQLTVRSVEFPEANMRIAGAGGLPETLPVHFHTLYGIMVACWRVGFLGRLVFLFTGKIWVSTLVSKDLVIDPQSMSVSKGQALEKK